MGRRSKKFGGVKQKRQGATPAATAADSASPRKFGGVKAVPSGPMESCPDNCPGEWIASTWIHSRECPWASVLWKAHGKTWKDWHCPFDCEPYELPSGWTHPYACPFWDRTGRTPFDHPQPRRDVPVQSAMESALLLGASVRQQKERIRRGESQEISAREVTKVYDETEFPDALRDKDEDTAS